MQIYMYLNEKQRGNDSQRTNKQTKTILHRGLGQTSIVEGTQLNVFARSIYILIYSGSKEVSREHFTAYTNF